MATSVLLGCSNHRMVHASLMKQVNRPAVARPVQRSLPQRSCIPSRSRTWRRAATNGSQGGDEASSNGSGNIAQRRAILEPLRMALNEAIAAHTKATNVRVTLENEVVGLFEKVINRQEGKIQVDQVAAEAMKAVEAAVKDEVEAAAVVKATQEAIDKTLKVLESVGDGSAVSASAPEASSGYVRFQDQLGSTSTASSNAAKAVEAVAIATNGSATQKKAASHGHGHGHGHSKAKEPVTPEKQMQFFLLGSLVMIVGACLAAIGQTPAGAAVMEPIISKIAAVVGPIHIGHAEAGLLEVIWLLLTSCIMVPAVVKLIPGGSPVLGYLIAGAIVGPHALGLIHDLEHMKHIAEMGVVLLLFNIGLELSLDKLMSMAKMVFGLGALQVGLTVVGVAAVAMALTGLNASSAIILGGALAMSTTAVAVQVLNDRKEMGSRHGRGTFSILLFQDLAVVVLLMLIPLLAPSETGGGMAKIAAALGAAGLKAIVCIATIIAVGRKVVQPLYEKVSSLNNPDLFMATTFLVVIGTSFTTLICGLSLALGAFLAGLLLAETDFHLQVESDIAPFKGLLMGLFFMTVGMEISVAIFLEHWQMILASLVVLLVGKVAIVTALGQAFGLSQLAALRAAMYIAPGGEFAFVAFGEAVNKGVLSEVLTGKLTIMVALSMALVPYLATLGSVLGQMFDKKDVMALQPKEEDTHEYKDHVIILGYGRVGEIIGQLLSEQLIPFVALDVKADRVQQGRSLDLPVYFGDAGSANVLHLLGAERAACAVIALDSPGANYRAVWAMNKNFPQVKTYVRATDVRHGLKLEKAGATVVVPETLEPSLQLAASVLAELDTPKEDIPTILNKFRKDHLSALQAIATESGTTLGFAEPVESNQENVRTPQVVAA